MTKEQAIQAINKKVCAGTQYWNDRFNGKIINTGNGFMTPPGLKKVEDYMDNLIVNNEEINDNKLESLLSDWADCVKVWIDNIENFLKEGKDEQTCNN